MNYRYRLFYGSIELGEVVEKDSDFPSLFGTFYPSATEDQTPISGHLQRYIAHAIAADRLMQEGDEEKWDKFAGEHEPRFLDLIGTNDWQLRNEEDIEPILISIFGQGNAIVWRWNVITMS